MSVSLDRYRDAVLGDAASSPHSENLLIERHGALHCHYAPFEHINRAARIVLVGITPGAQQAGNALAGLRRQLLAGAPDDKALAAAKQTASFSGPMRANLIALLDGIGLAQPLGVGSCAALFDERTDLVHFTSALRYPVFVAGKDYSGTPAILSTPPLRAMARRWLAEEIFALPDALWVPLGREPAAVLADAVSRGELRADRVLAGLPHPSGANAERIAYFLGRKARDALSPKTNAASLDQARSRLVQQIAAWAT